MFNIDEDNGKLNRYEYEFKISKIFSVKKEKDIFHADLYYTLTYISIPKNKMLLSMGEGETEGEAIKKAKMNFMKLFKNNIGRATIRTKDVIKFFK